MRFLISAALVLAGTAAFAQSDDATEAPLFTDDEVTALVAAVEAAGCSLDGTAPEAVEVMGAAGFTDPEQTRAIAAHLVEQGEAVIEGPVLTVITEECPEG